ncbi:hypothetical protein HP550_02245 [Cellulomonas humilata]|uniref:Uncharacterized protein n=1 Tax=Cellulomonas humilata TaxID=144055 RepID=A0A7Y6DWK7_9CELL|nr:hypothetical protein [Cellulomonas humilata]NUU16072.1 hypothetical protein [Cellulomonas humilata]
MSPDLSRALHDAVDTGPDDAPFDVLSLTGRIRRRRTVRAGVRGGVAVGAVGAVAFGAVYVGGRQPSSVLPAARADAGPGTCGSDIGLLPTAEPGRVGLLPSTDGSWYMDEPSSIPPQGTDLGTLLGRTMSPVLVRELSPDARDAAVAELVRSANESLADAEAHRASRLANPPGGAPLTAGEVDALDRGVEVARDQLELAQTSESITVVGDELDSRVLITHDGTVVASDADPAPDPRYAWMSSSDRSVAMGLTSTELITCATDGEPGGVPLPAGEYSVYVSYAEAGGRAVAGPWSLTLLDMPPAPTGFPEGFPVDDVPLIGGRLVSVTPMAGSSGEGWSVVIAADGDDAAKEAVRLLGDDWSTYPALAPPPGITFPVAGWEVGVTASTSEDGEPTVVYSILPD